MTRLNNIFRNPQAFNRWSLTLRRQYSSLEPIPPPPLSTVHRGNAFEERSLRLLEQTMSMSLKRVGGKEDGGIDLVGWWWLPELSSNASEPRSNSKGRRRIRVVGQCKAEKKKLGPNYVRELEGVIYRFLNSPTAKTESISPKDSAPFSLVALLISQSAFTKSTILHAQSSPIPFFLLHLPPTDALLDSENSPGKLGSALCNPALFGQQGLLKGHMDVRWERHHLGDGGRPALWWKNEKMESHIPDLERPDTTSSTP
ncbi:hypothetical protein M413DRAFT_449027 [Hebeloma cylindrosporum]|uniref:Required for respiratory growth protein 7, mitochondrial n=1 Tax=Hebeloma cylindrosporum TaxID=76867 RepID=A0A0C3BZ19_HEBCY|nr:hypothetical protein M413DRAFT_449027 [Hebeloma cylindrosporum h7]